MRNKYGRAMSKAIGDWPAIEAPDESWACVGDPDEMQPEGVVLDVIWVVANPEFRSMRLSFGSATCENAEQREWRNKMGQQVVFNPTFWRIPHEPKL